MSPEAYTPQPVPTEEVAVENAETQSATEKYQEKNDRIKENARAVEKFALEQAAATYDWDQGRLDLARKALANKS